MAENQTFQVGLKAFIRKGDTLLVLRENDYDKKGDCGWELPGGRVQTDETEVSLEEILRREIAEECGDGLVVTVGSVRQVWRRIVPWGQIFLVGFECLYNSGEIVLSDEHNAFAWISESDLGTYQFAQGYQEPIAEFFKSLK